MQSVVIKQHDHSPVFPICLSLEITVLVFTVCNAQKPVIQTHPTDGYVARDRPYTLYCNVDDSSAKPITFSWYKDNQRVSTQFDDPSSVHSILNGNLFFLKFEIEDAGIYYCNATNQYGSAVSRNASLQLAGKVQRLDCYLQPECDQMIICFVIITALKGGVFCKQNIRILECIMSH